jgi:flagellar basal-body rod modification protein FlgD
MSSVSATSNVAATDQSPNPSQTLGQAQFLQLLVTQMTQQDPLNPQSDTAFAAQLAQFSALQESTSMAGNMANLQANGLLGQTVTVASATNTSQRTTGVVSGIDISSGTPEIVINNQPFNLSQIVSVEPTPTATSNGIASTTANSNVKP